MDLKILDGRHFVLPLNRCLYYSHGISPLKRPGNDNLFTSNTDKANILNEQFQSVFTPTSPLSLAQLTQNSIHNSLSQGRLSENHIPDQYRPQYPKMPEISISENGITKLLANLKPDKAAGPDGIKPLVLRSLKSQISPILHILFQKSLSSGVIPADWSTATVCPLFKKGARSNPANYRPISLTCVICKVMEHIIASSLAKHFTNHHILYDLQHGFREKRSCETQLIELVEELSSNLSKGRQSDLILLDFSKAF